MKNEVLCLLRGLNTTRRNEFSDEVISEDKILEIKKSIIHTANTSNRQIYSIIILNKTRLGIIGTEQGSHAFIFCVDFHRLHGIAGKLDQPFDTNYLTQFLSGLVDISLLAQSTVIAAKSLGIGTMITNKLYLEDSREIYEKLNIPSRDCIPLLMVHLGYAKSDKRDKKGRLPLDVVFHEGSYHELNNDDIDNLINIYDDDGNGLALNNTWKNMNYRHYLEWFFEKWSPIIGSRKNSGIFLDELTRRKLL
jgi:FMN reductase [NAD(P)H]